MELNKKSQLMQVINNSKKEERLGRRVAWQFLEYGLTIALIVMPLIGCDKKERAGNNEQSISHTSSQNNERSEDYFPLHVGNFWTYKRTVNNNARYAYVAEETSILTGESRTILSKGIVPSVTDGFETYNITERTANEFNVDFSCEGGIHILDGRYDFDLLESVIWKYAPGNDYQSVAEIRRGISRGSKIFSYGRLLVLTPFIEMTEHNRIKISCDFSPGEVTVPAGTFDHLWVNVIKYKDPDEMRSFKDVIHLAPGVGMIKKVHYDDRGQEIGRLELMSFKAESFKRLN